jgi:predicted kinase
MLETAGFLLEQNGERIIFLDGRPFSRRYQIENVVHAAELLHQSWRILECVCVEQVVKQRLEELGREHPAANRDFQLYLEVRSRFEAITLPKTVIDTALPLETCTQQALAALP